MRIARFLLPALLAASCADQPADVPPPPVVEAVPDTTNPPREPALDIHLSPLTGSGLRFDGAYRASVGDLRYYMRFFERGSAAFVGGTEKYDGQLAGLLTIDVKSGWNQVHNCPVERRNDSLFIRSVGMKGVITYGGDVRANGDSVRFLRHSEINGSNQIMRYAFVPDSALQPKP
jgi:hypothetical protein